MTCYVVRVRVCSFIINFHSELVFPSPKTMQNRRSYRPTLPSVGASLFCSYVFQLASARAWNTFAALMAHVYRTMYSVTTSMTVAMVAMKRTAVSYQ